MSTLPDLKSRDEILKAFAPLLRSFEAQVAVVATKAEAAQEAADREIVGRAAGYSVESIVKGLAELQLSFGAAVDALSDQVEAESVKLDELRRAIEVERRRHDSLQSTRIAADALEILKQDHARKLQVLEADAAEAQATLARQTEETRAGWAKARADREQAEGERLQALQKARAQSEADYSYELERERRLEADASAERRRLLERELGEQDATKEKAWGAREQALSAASGEIEALRPEVAGYEAAIEEAQKKARDKGIAAVTRDAKHEADLLSREVAANLEVYELKIKSLDEAIVQQAAEIDALGKQLAEALSQSTTLAHKAMQGK
ncbi:MAG: hypothetical protein R3B09_11730 [Nannocystaceae bacterium]